LGLLRAESEMLVATDDHERTLVFAETALRQIRALKHPATPRNFEVWYHYATGYNAALNQKINDILAHSGTLSEADVNEIYEAHISPKRLTDRLDRVNLQVMDELDQVIALINSAIASSSRYGESLADASEGLVQADGPDGWRAIVETLLQKTHEMCQVNRTLEARLLASKQEISDLKENLEAVRTESLTDPLTTLANRKYFDHALEGAIVDSAADGTPLSLLMIDIDHFKNFNDSYGHLTGDQVLRLVAVAVKQNVKGQDIAARYGGEEFTVVLPHTVLRSAITVADHIRRAVMTKELMKRSTGEHLGRVTISIGVAALRGGESMASLIERADACLYAAKRTGRNRVISESDPEMQQSKRQKVA
jgi:diguanylate cyclase